MTEFVSQKSNWSQREEDIEGGGVSIIFRKRRRKSCENFHSNWSNKQLAPGTHLPGKFTGKFIIPPPNNSGKLLHKVQETQGGCFVFTSYYQVYSVWPCWEESLFFSLIVLLLPIVTASNIYLNATCFSFLFYWSEARIHLCLFLYHYIFLLNVLHPLPPMGQGKESPVPSFRRL